MCEACRSLDVTLDDQVRTTLRGRGWSDEQIEQQFRPRNDGLPNCLSNRYFHFYNKLARRLAQVAPDAYVTSKISDAARKSEKAGPVRKPFSQRVSPVGKWNSS